MIHVLGHINPDTDAILSAMIYASFLKISGTQAQAYRLGELNPETEFVLKYLGWEAPELITTLPTGSDVALTDHNEASQSISNLSDLNVVAIVDHHKFAYTSSQPIDILVRPIASTCSVIYGLWKATGLLIPQDIATAMMMGIISDTLYFRSPITTIYDQEIFVDLNKIAAISDPEQLSLDMFAAKSDLGNMAIRDLVTMDYKTFESHGKLIGIATLETTNPGYVMGRKDEIVADLQLLKHEQQLTMVMLCVVDILNEHNTTIVPTDQDANYVAQIFDTSHTDLQLDLGNRISRKKQLAGPVVDYFAQ